MKQEVKTDKAQSAKGLLSQALISGDFIFTAGFIHITPDGKWEIRELEDNKSAQEFWRKIIREYTNNKFKKTSLDNEKWRGTVQTFDNSNIINI